MIHYAKQGWFKSDDNYPVRLSMLKKLAGSLFDAFGIIITSKSVRKCMKMEVLFPLQKKDASHAGTVLADIFQHDPVWQVLFRDPSPHLDKLAGRLRRGHRLVARLVGRQSITKTLIHTYFGENS